MKRLIHISWLILLLMGGFATAAELYVSPAGPYTTIQSAIDAAAEGDVVKVADGTYTGPGNRNLTFRGKAITVRSENGPGNCIIDCQRGGRGFGFYNDEGDDSEVDGFTIKEGRADYGGGIDCYYASPRIVNCVIRDCRADMDGGGIACFEAEPQIFNCLLVNNSAGGYGGGAISCDGSSAWITLCTLVGNTTSGDGGGVYCYYNADAVIRNCIFADSGSYAIYEADDSSNPLVKYSLFYNNEPNDYYDFSDFYGGRGLSGGAAINALIPDISSNESNIDGDPLFRTGPLGDYYLSQVVAGQLLNSDCINAGSAGAGPYGLEKHTTATNSTLEGTSLVDLGYHYTDTGPVGQYDLVTSVDATTPYGTISPSPGGLHQQYGEVLLTATPDYGYEVERWSGDVAGTPFLNVDDPCHNIVRLLEARTHDATVRFKERVPWELTTVVVNGIGGTIDPCGVTVQFEGLRVRLTAIPELGYTVKSWEGTDNDACVGLINYVTLYSNRTVYVEFTASDVYLSTRVDPDTPYGMIRPRSGYQPLDLAGASPVEITALPDEDYRVETWYVNGEPFLDPNDPCHISVVMDEDKEVVVRFTSKVFYYLTTTVVGGQGELHPESGLQYGDETVTLTAVPTVGWRVRQWTGTDDDSSIKSTNTVFMDSDKEVTVEFEEGLPYNTIWVANGATGKPYPRSPIYRNPYSTIQAAIDDAKSAFPGFEGDDEASPLPLPAIPNSLGDIVLVADGVYKGTGNKDLEFFTLNNDQGLTSIINDQDTWLRVGDYKVITVRSEHGPEKCIIDCEGSGAGFSFGDLEWNDAVVEGLTFKNCSGFSGGALNVTGPSGPVFRNCIITNCSAINGGGAYFEGLEEDDTTYEDLVEEAEMAADLAEEAAEGTDPPYTDLALNRVAEAARTWAIVYAGLVEGVSAPDTNRPTLSNCKVTGNTSLSHGGGVYCATNASPVVISTEISHNAAGGGGLPGAHGGGAYCAETGGVPPAFINCLITGNSSTEIGGAAYLYLSDATFNLCTVAHNYGLDYGDMDGPLPVGPKGGICARESDPTITNCIVGRNGSTDPSFGTWGDQLTHGDDLYECAATSSCIENGDDGEGNIDLDPLFRRGGLGDYYLSHVEAGQGVDSNCIDAGEQYILSDLEDEPPDGYNLDEYITTSIQNNFDDGYADMGYHYPLYYGEPVRYALDLHVGGEGQGVVHYYYYPHDVSLITGIVDIWDLIGDSNYVGTVPWNSNEVSVWDPGTLIFFVTEADDPASYRGAWYGTAEDTSTNIWNYVFMYGDRDVRVDFDPILGRELRVPEDYELIQDAIDAARYQDQVVIERAGSDNPYRTAQGFLVSNKAIIIRSEEPNNPACVADTVIELEIGPEGYLDITCFRFNSVDRDTVINGITIANFNTQGYDGIDGDPARGIWDGWPGQSIYGAAIQCGGPMPIPGQRGVFGLWGANASPTIKNCIIRDCNAIAGSGGDGAGPSDPHMPDGGHGGWPGRAYGAGICALSYSSPLVMNCTFENLTTLGGEGGNGAQGNTDPAFYGKGGRGGGWYYNSPPPTPYDHAGNRSRAYLHDEQNFDYYSEYSARGGAVYVDEYCHPEFVNCSFTNCRTEGGLCGICGQDGWPPEDRERPSDHWKIDNFGGAAFVYANGSAVFRNCTFSNNFADTNRPVFDPEGPADDPYNCDNDDLVVGYGGAIAYKGNADVVFENCTFTNNTSDEGGAIYGARSGVSFTGCSFTDNTSGSGGALLLAACEGAKLNGCDFISNVSLRASERGGAICSLGTNAIITDCRILNNSAEGFGGGIYISSKDIGGGDIVIDGKVVLGWNEVLLQNCLIAGNFSNGNGGGISANWNSEPNIINCTIVDNVASGSGPDTGYAGGLLCSFASNASVLDSIIWGNSANFGNQIAIVGSSELPAVVNVRSSNVQGAQSNAYVGSYGTLNWDPNNLYVDPLFVLGPFGDYYLSQIAAGQSQDSPSVDAGSDLASRVGMSRYTTRTDEIFDRGVVDMGYHHSYSAKAEPCRFCDLVFDHMINFKDYALFAMNWLREGCSEENDWCADSDFTFNTTVGIDDVLLFIECWLVEDRIAPLPNPSRWAIEPYSNTLTSITMTAETAVDIWGGDVLYYFDCAYGDCDDSGWISGTSYNDSGLVGYVEYGYRVKASDEYGNETEWSPTRFAITSDEPPPPPDNNPPTPNPMDFANPPHAVSETSVAMTALQADDPEGSDVQYFFEELTGQVGGDDSGWIESRTYTDSGLMTGSTYRYRVRARDTSVQLNMTLWSDEFEATPEAGVEPNEPTDDTNPPAPVAWEVIPWESGSTYNAFANMTAAEAFDPEGAGVQYYFECYDYPSINSGWTLDRVWNNVPIGAAMRGLRFRFRVRDMSPNLNKSAWSTILPCYPPW
jgi:hypothetical protein